MYEYRHQAVGCAVSRSIVKAFLENMRAGEVFNLAISRR